MPEIDPSFTALPYRELGAVALGRAQELGATHADFRFERIRHQHLAVRDGVLQTAMDADDEGFAVRVIHRGSWGFASGVVQTGLTTFDDSLLSYVIFAANVETRALRFRTGLGEGDDIGAPACK